MAFVKPSRNSSLPPFSVILSIRSLYETSTLSTLSPRSSILFPAFFKAARVSGPAIPSTANPAAS